MKKALFTIFSFFFFCLTILTINLRGEWGNPTVEKIEAESAIPGNAFESSMARGRFAQTMALVEDKRADLTNGKEIITMPDLGVVKGKAYPLFAPGLAFYSMPAYIIGAYLNASQLSVFFFIAICASLAACLVVILAKSLGASLTAACFSGLTYLFGTTALPYAVTLAQHNLTVLFLLTIVIAAFHGKKHSWLYALGWAAYALAILMDYPNLVLLGPAILYMMVQSFSLRQDSKKSVTVHFRLALLYASITFAVISGLHGYYNWKHFGNPAIIGPAVYTRAQNVQELQQLLKLNPEETKKPANVADTLFDISNIPNGLQVLLVSKGRGVIYFAPVVIMGLLGVAHLILKSSKQRIGIIFLALVTVNLLLYSSFGDPWGGWVFGPRYLTPAFSILASAIGLVLTRIKNVILHLSIFMLFAYGVFVNLLGTLTTSQLPAEIEAIPLNLPYTYQYNYDLLISGMNSGIVYKTWLTQSLSSLEFFIIINALILIPAFMLLIKNFLNKPKSESKKRSSIKSQLSTLFTSMKLPNLKRA